MLDNLEEEMVEHRLGFRLFLVCHLLWLHLFLRQHHWVPYLQGQEMLIYPMNLCL